VLVAGCGSSSGSTTVSTAGTPTVRSSDLRRLAQVPGPNQDAPSSASGDSHAFLERVFQTAEAMWERAFGGVKYTPARLTIFTREVDTACGTQSAAVGPFYCPATFGVYLDPQFFAALSRRVGVQLGDFAQAYVVAHEVGHHVQTLLGLSRQKAVADKEDPEGKNPRSVRFELQADCFAGVWAHSAYKQGEFSRAGIRDALNAATVVGDDFQSRASGSTRPPEEWTHGSSAQRQHWFMTGFTTGDPGSCDTFPK
jgi:predicted metalloprotease